MEEKDNIEKTIDVYEEIAEEYSNIHTGVENIKENLNYFIQNLKGKKVLDIGCGPGRDAKYFLNKGLEVIGIDLTKKFIDIASKNVLGVKFIQMDMRKLQFPENYFDGIWSCAAFLHIPKDEAKLTLEGFTKVLKSGGLIYVSVKKGDKEEFVEAPEYKNKKRFFAFYNEEEFENLIKSCGLKILRKDIDEKRSTWINIFAVKT